MLDAEQNACGADQKSRGWSASRSTEGTGIEAPFICISAGKAISFGGPFQGLMRAGGGEDHTGRRRCEARSQRDP